MNIEIPDLDDIGKLFVGGLSSQTTKETLQSYFSQFGEVVDSVVMKNNETGRSRGFGFVTFKDPYCVLKTLQIKNHDLDGKRIDPKECTPRSMQKSRKQAGKCKIFLGGLPPDITEEAIRSGMSKFGKVNQVIIMLDQETKKCRGFGFLSFELEESIDQACAERYVIISGKQIECKRAEPRTHPKHFLQFHNNRPRNQNGFVRQQSYGGQIPSMNQSNWNIPSQPVYNIQGNSYPSGYQNYGNSVASYNTNPLNFGGLTTLPYPQSYQQNYASTVASYSYPSVPSASTYVQPVFMTSAQTSDAAGTATVSTAIIGKSYAADVTYSNSSAAVPASYQRFHPYKA